MPENSKAKILLDFSKQTDHVIQARRPDIVLKDKDLNHTWVIKPRNNFFFATSLSCVRPGTLGLN